jgi:DNA-binding HxlR family transcriptional regulator
MAKKVKNKSRSVCPVSNTLELVGDRWTLLIVRDMMFFGRHEYHEFLNADEGISTNILAERLKRLTQSGVADWIPHPDDRKRKLYYLTEKGKDLLGLMMEIVMWGGEHLEASAPARPKVRRVQRSPARFRRKVLKDLSAWEKQFLQ